MDSSFFSQVLLYHPRLTSTHQKRPYTLYKSKASESQKLRNVNNFLTFSDAYCKSFLVIFFVKIFVLWLKIEKKKGIS